MQVLLYFTYLRYSKAINCISITLRQVKNLVGFSTALFFPVVNIASAHFVPNRILHVLTSLFYCINMTSPPPHHLWQKYVFKNSGTLINLPAAICWKLKYYIRLLCDVTEYNRLKTPACWYKQSLRRQQCDPLLKDNLP